MVSTKYSVYQMSPYQLTKCNPKQSGDNKEQKLHGYFSYSRNLIRIGFGFAVYIGILGLNQISVDWPTWAEESLWKGLKNLSIFF